MNPTITPRGVAGADRAAPDPRGDGFIQTASGHAFWPLDARPEEVLIEDVAHALAALPRYTGHARRPYAVGQHSVLVSYLLDPWGPQAALDGLLHDATEAYLNDISGPLKALDSYRHFRDSEDALALVIALRFDLRAPFDDALARLVKRADSAMLWWEASSLMRRPDGTLPPWWDVWRPLAEGFPAAPLGCREVDPWDFDATRSIFLSRFHELTEARSR